MPAHEKSANSPVELLLIALCACSASDVVSILRKKREPFTAWKSAHEADRSETFPKVFTSIRMVYRVSGKVARNAVEHAVSLSEKKYCSVSAMMAKSAKIEFVIEYDEVVATAAAVVSGCWHRPAPLSLDNPPRLVPSYNR